MKLFVDMPHRHITEFEFIRLFTRAAPRRGEGVVLGIGDDAAVLRPPRGELLVATVDAVVEGVHFERGWRPEDVGWKALAVNLSDLAAMGARPLWALVALAMPRAEEPGQVARIGRGLWRCARLHGIAVVGGNVTAASELSVAVTAIGSARRPLRRSGAKPGDAVLVSGTLGDAALGREPGAPASLARRQRRPAPRLALGRALAGLATACIDLSDGLVQDLGHVCRASGVGAVLRLCDVPLSRAYRAAAQKRPDPWEAALSGGDDYELCVTVPPAEVPRALGAGGRTGAPLTVIGHIVPGRRVRVLDEHGRPRSSRHAGHDHLAAPAADIDGAHFDLERR